jgi:hypothetical protein
LRELLNVFLVEVSPHEIFLVVDYNSDTLGFLCHDGQKPPLLSAAVSC